MEWIIMNKKTILIITFLIISVVLTSAYIYNIDNKNKENVVMPPMITENFDESKLNNTIDQVMYEYQKDISTIKKKDNKISFIIKKVAKKFNGDIDYNQVKELVSKKIS